MGNIPEWTSRLKQETGGHILYFFQDEETYVQNAVSYIRSGIEQGDHVLFVENDRILLSIRKKLSSLTEDQARKVHFMNNFDFYIREGNFHPDTLVSNFSESVDFHLNQNSTIRTWGHVEWGDEACIIEDTIEFEQKVHEKISANHLITVCAYHVNTMSDSLKVQLIQAHDYLMADDGTVSLEEEQIIRTDSY